MHITLFHGSLFNSDRTVNNKQGRDFCHRSSSYLDLFIDLSLSTRIRRTSSLFSIIMEEMFEPMFNRWLLYIRLKTV